MNKQLEKIIDYFEIKGLFNEQTIKIPFDNNVKIIVGENGIGKTTILNILYYTISCNFHKLSQMDFDTLIIRFKSGVELTIRNEDLKFIPDEESKFMSDMKRILTEEEILEILNLIRTDQKVIRHPLFKKVSYNYKMSSSFILRKLSEYTENNYDLYEKYKNIIKREIPYQVIYFPTYRRIEEDLHNLDFEYNYDNLAKDKGKLIQFGMTDVTARFENITTIIKNSAIEGFSKVTGEMLRQLVDGIKITEKMREDIKQPEALRIVLERVGDNIPTSDRKLIIELIESGDIAQPKYNPLIYLLSNLIKIYDQQREKDNSIKKFAAICNKYLVNKKLDYNENSVEIQIVQTKNDHPIQINRLSSGEKQVVSLFSKIYLDMEKDFIFIFDEPELSLSIEWQKEILPDIWASNKCCQLIVATHSPFIFDNEFDHCAVALQNYVRELD